MEFKILPDLISKNAAAYPDKVCIFFKECTYTYAQVEQKIVSTAITLKNNGVRRGDRVVILLENSPEFTFAYFGIMKLGAIAVPTNVFLKDREIAINMNDCDAEYIITSETFAERMTHIFELALQLKKIFSYGKVSFNTVHIEDLTEELPEVNILPGDLALVLYTSGTTGRPKGVMLEHRNVLANAETVAAFMKYNSDDRMLLVLPMFHATSMLASMLASLAQSAGVIILESILEVSKAYYPKMLAKLKPTLTVGVPALFATLTRAKVTPETREAVFPFRIALCGGAPLPVEIINRFKDVYGKIILEGYGLSEASPVLSVNPITKQKVGTIGVPLPGVDIKIVDENDNEAPLNTPGELIARGPNVMRGYWNQPEESERTLRNGWLHTGDIASQDEEGYITIIDRLKDLILVKGMNVYPREIEELLYKYSGVITAAVVGIPDGEGSEIPVAYVKINPESEVTVDALKKYIRHNIASFKAPRRFIITDDIPLNAGGKVMKKELRERAKKDFM
ncbi:MAG: long-chain-fatty-acid--CoA ligase [Deferribacteraceae bacterium]|nr:long-chain-fatty-acid--CoA ligase [Deferribacteraceae bacterium]